MRYLRFGAGIISLILTAALIFPSGEITDRVLLWDFEPASADMDDYAGGLTLTDGISGRGLRFDGYTARVTRRADPDLEISGGFTVTAWAAPAAYPWNKCPILAQQSEDGRGYSFGITPDGRPYLEARIDGKRTECRGDQPIPLREWTHLSAVLDPMRGMTVFVNGRPAGRVPVTGVFDGAEDQDMLIGSIPRPISPANAVPPGAGTLPSWFSFDGLLDEIRLKSHAAGEEDIAAEFEKSPRVPEPDLPERKMPSGSPGPARFGAYYENLKFHPDWDALWRIADHPDVVIRFDDSPIRVVFWRGLRFSPAWVTDTDLWLADQSGESGTRSEGCVEHMQDIHCRYSRVSVIESNPARAVVHWRYAPVSAHDHLWTSNRRSGRAWWMDEIYTFFPDGTGVRCQEWREPDPDLGFPWLQLQETSVLCHPYQQAGEVLARDAITRINLAGESRVYGWPDNDEENTRHRRNLPHDPSIIRDLEPEDAVIQAVSLISRFRHFIIFEPGTRSKVYVGRVRADLARFPAYNHWPVCQARSDGRFAQAADRASSFSISQNTPVIHRDEEGRLFTRMLYGMSDADPRELVQLARSWIRPPELNVISGPAVCTGYDRSRRAYRIRIPKDSSPGRITLAFDASEQRPFAGGSLVLENWGEGNISLTFGKDPAVPGRDYRTGYHRRLDGTDLVIWIPRRTDRSFQIELVPDPDEREAP